MLERRAGGVVPCPSPHVVGEPFASEMTGEEAGPGDYRSGNNVT